MEYLTNAGEMLSRGRAGQGEIAHTQYRGPQEQEATERHPSERGSGMVNGTRSITAHISFQMNFETFPLRLKGKKEKKRGGESWQAGLPTSGSPFLGDFPFERVALGLERLLSG